MRGALASVRARALRVALVAATVVVLGAPSAARATPTQATQSDDRLTSRLDAATAAAVRAELDQARLAGVPTEPLVQRALLGAARRVPSARIVEAVRELRRELTVARAALGPVSREAELVAAAAAVHGGASAEILRALRVARGGRPVTVALATLTDLVALGVPVDTAAATVLSLARRGASDAEIILVRERVEADVAAGGDPSAAARVRSGRAREPQSGAAQGRGATRAAEPPGPGRGQAAGATGAPGARGAGKGAPPSVPRRPDPKPKKPKP